LKLTTGFSVKPLRLAVFAGGAMAVVSFLTAAFFLIQAFVLDRIPEGYPSLIVAMFFLGGIQLMGLGAVGEYVGRIFITQSQTPQFSIGQVVRHGARGNPVQTPRIGSAAAVIKGGR
jgi:undecaprenyl-phosphate 4-deoxy-4-formamido-L-arabinose transferase